MKDDLTEVAQASARGGFFLVSGSALSTVILAVASILVARILGPELYGQYALAIVAPEFLFLFTDLGLNQAIMKFTSSLKSKNETNRIPNIIKHGLLIRVIIGLAIFILNYNFADLIATYLLQRPELAFFIQIASVAILFQVIFTTATSAFIGLDKTEYQAIAINVQALAKTIISITLILAGLGVAGAVTGHTTSFIITALISLPLIWLALRQNKAHGTGEDFKTNLKKLFEYGTPLYVSALIVGFLPILINVTLAFFTTDTDIGNYKAAANFIGLLLVLAVPINTILLPAFSKLTTATHHKIRDFFQIAVKYTSMIVVPVTILLIIFSDVLIQIVYGQTYTSASMYLSVYCLLYFLVGMGYLTLSSLFSGLEKTKTTMKMSLIIIIIFALLAVPLTQAIGVQGAIVALLIAQLVSTTYGATKAKKTLQIEYNFKNTAKIYLAAVLSTSIPLLLINFTSLPKEINLALGGVIYLTSYITLLPLFDAVTLPELQRISLATQNTPILKQIVKLILNYQQKILQLKPKKTPEKPT